MGFHFFFIESVFKSVFLDAQIQFLSNYFQKILLLLTVSCIVKNYSIMQTMKLHFLIRFRLFQDLIKTRYFGFINSTLIVVSILFALLFKYSIHFLYFQLIVSYIDQHYYFQILRLICFFRLPEL
jgi:hypothetical protein